MTINPEDFIQKQGILEANIDYKLADQLVAQVKEMEHLTNKFFTVFDYFKNEYIYISNSDKIFSNSKQKKNFGYQLLVDNSDPEGVYMMYTIQQRAFDFLRKQNPSDRIKYMFTVNVGLLNDGKITDVCFRVKPQVLDKLGNIWLTMTVIEETQNFTRPHVLNIETGDIHYFKPLKNEELEKQTKQLSKTEFKILEYFVAEKSTSEICKLLEIKEPTFKRHRQQIYSKIGAKSRISAVNKAYIYGIIK